MWTILLLFKRRVWGCPTSKHCVWIVFAPLARWGGACPKHSSSIVSTTVSFFSLSLHLGFFISSFKNLDQPLQFIFHSYLVHVILITVFLFWIVHDITIFFFNFTLHHFLNYKQFITLQMFFQFHSLWFLLFQIQLSFSWLLFFHLGPFLF